MPLKRIVCLANSRKMQGRCIAGRELVDGRLGAWVRPVSNRAHEEVSADERCYQDKTEPQILDIIDIPLIRSWPKPHQPENWLLDHSTRWKKVGHFGNATLASSTETDTPLWINGHNTSNGHNNRFPVDQLEDSGRSLRLIYVSGLRLFVHVPSRSHRSRVEASFHFNRSYYTLRVTDPSIEDGDIAKSHGLYSLGPSYLTISLGEPFQGDYYKLVAAVIGADQ